LDAEKQAKKEQNLENKDKPKESAEDKKARRDIENKLKAEKKEQAKVKKALKALEDAKEKEVKKEAKVVEKKVAVEVKAKPENVVAPSPFAGLMPTDMTQSAKKKLRRNSLIVREEEDEI